MENDFIVLVATLVSVGGYALGYRMASNRWAANAKSMMRIEHKGRLYTVELDEH